MLTRFTTAVWLGLLPGLAGLTIAHSAGTTASATATIVTADNFTASVSPDNLPASVSFTSVLFNTSTGVLTFRINGAPARAALVQSLCGLSRGSSRECSAPTTFKVVSDGTLNGKQSVSISLSQSDDNKAVVLAMLAYD